MATSTSIATECRCRWCGAGLEGASSPGARRLRCATCGVDTTYPYPDAAELDEAYGDWYRPDAGRFSGVGDRLLKRTRGRLAARLDEIAPAGPVFDIGSGDGTLLAALGARGREAYGSERSDDVAGHELEERRWAAIVLWHSLEHLPDAGTVVAGLAAHLQPGGVVVVAVPNPASMQAQAFGDRWLALDLPRHLVHIPAASLTERLAAAGMTVERVSYLRGGQVTFGWLHGIVGLLPSHPDLYDAIRRPEARSSPITPGRRLFTLAAATLLLPAALVATAVEVIARRGGTVYVEARRD